MLDPRQLQPALTEKEIILREGFVCEYLKDFDAYKACLRLGFQATYATVWCETLFKDGYVQRKLAYMTSNPVANPQEEAEDLALVKQTLRRVMLHGSDSARATAAHKMMILRNWDKQEGNEADEDLVESFKRIAEQLPT